MNKRAQAAFHNELRTILSTSDKKVAGEAFVRLAKLADILDQHGDEASADHIDRVIKEANWFWDMLLGGAGGAATTKNESGQHVWDALKPGGGGLGAFFSKDTIVKMITNFLITGGIAMLSGELVKIVSEKVPIFSWLGDSSILKAIFTSALTYAVRNTDFVQKFVDNLVEEAEQVLGMKVKSEQPAKPTEAPKPAAPSQPIAQTQPPKVDTLPGQKEEESKPN